MRPLKIAEIQLERQLTHVLGRWVRRRGGELQSYAEAGLLTDHRGLVLTRPDGAEFHLTIVEGKPRW